jgi:hypothetical protein
MAKVNKKKIMKLKLKKVKLYLAIFCIGFMAFFLGLPIVPKETIEKMLKANNQNIAAEIVEATDEQS